MEHDDRPVTISPVRARQGVISGRILTVLVISVALAIVAMAVSWWLLR